LTITMGFMEDGQRTAWEIQEVRWNLDERQDAAIELWRRSVRPAMPSWNCAIATPA
jgi:hypothetical protein